MCYLHLSPDKTRLSVWFLNEVQFYNGTPIEMESLPLNLLTRFLCPDSKQLTCFMYQLMKFIPPDFNVPKDIDMQRVYSSEEIVVIEENLKYLHLYPMSITTQHQEIHHGDNYNLRK